jgi:hypothetical protein
MLTRAILSKRDIDSRDLFSRLADACGLSLARQSQDPLRLLCRQTHLSVAPIAFWSSPPAPRSGAVRRHIC